MNVYLEKPIGQLYARLIPASVVSVLIQAAASLVDTIIISYFMGPVAMSAVNICMPLTIGVSAVALLLSGGAGTLYSQFLGKGDKEKADKIFTLAFMVLFAVGVIFSVLGAIFPGEIVRFLGANDAVFEMSRDYAGVLAFFFIPSILFPILQNFVRIDLNPNLTVWSIIACVAVNFTLDVLFIGPYLRPEGFGTAGAAFATGLAYVVAVLVVGSHFTNKKKNTLHLVKKFFNINDLGKIITTGIPASVTLFGNSITMAVFNSYIITRGDGYAAGVGELYVSVYSVIVQLITVTMSVYVGIAQASQPIIAANYGAGRKDRLKELFYKGLSIEVVANIILCIILWFSAEKIAGFFSLDKGVYDMTPVAAVAIHAYSLSLVFTGANQMIQYLFQSTEHVTQSTIISLLAGCVMLIIGLYLLADVVLRGNAYGLGIWLSYLFAQGTTAVYAFAVFKKLKAELFS